MNIKKYIGLIALATPLAAAAQLNIDFETAEAYTGIGVYDAWEESPFRTGLLQGNVKVIPNEMNEEDEILGRVVNPTANMLAVQCSRYGSNTFGARIDLAETFELTTTAKYVHVLVNKPTEGRVMLIGLGKRTERADQSPETEQFLEVASTKITPGKWCDAVFTIKGAGGIDIYSLVVVPECESPHNRTADFAAYIDEIVISDSPTPRVIYGDYPISYEETQASDKADRYLNSISLNGSSDGNQTIAVGSQSPQLIYRNLLDKTFTAKAGETLTPNFAFSANWMNGYVYLDRGNDGKFDATLNDDYTIPEGSDIMSYSYIETEENVEGYKSDGTKISGGARNFINPPAFRLPADLPNGIYRMRFKVDWGNVDPAGRNTATNSIVQNGGSIVDVRMNIHGDEVTVRRSGGLNGDLMNEDGTELISKTVPFGQPLTIVAKPASDNFKISYIKVRHGYNLDGDSLVHGTPQYIEDTFPAYLFKDNVITIPGEYIDGDVLIEPYFVDGGLEPTGEDYARNFADDLTVTRTDRKLNSFTFSATQGGTSTVTLATDGANLVYRNMTDKQVSVVPGDAVATTVNYTGRAMHLYLYVDLNSDGQFSPSLGANGVPDMSSELIAYSYYDGFNSAGASISAPGSVALDALPEFTLPANLPTGVYRARFKVDWNNMDPAGQWAADGNNKIDDNGGYVVDFLLNVHNATHRLDILTENGSVNGTGYTALPLALPTFQQLAVVPTPAAAGYTAEKMTIRHGHNFNGPQYIHGNRQWSEYEVPASNYTIPADSIDGDVAITVLFSEGAGAEYKLVFSDEFNEPDGTRPSDEKWVCSPRYSATWNRWIADDARVAFMQDGQLVTRAIPNPDPAKYDGDMITGAVQSSGGRFGFCYGKIEARILTNPHTGNFPAFWLMPDDQSNGWPNDGEIDIWEQIDLQNTAYHTLHTGYRQSMFSRNETVAMDRYHTYGFEWDAAKMIWYVDGKEVGRYNKTDISDPRSWPFDKTFYIILNQSVGNGSWAANADVAHTYETRFDWVRVYQKEGQLNTTGISPAGTEGLDVSASGGIIRLSATAPVQVCIADLSGRVLFSQTVNGRADVRVQPGVYVVNGRKMLVK